MSDPLQCELDGLSVLVIEDDLTLLQAMSGWLAAEGCKVAGAPDGRRGLDRFREKPAEVVVTDIIMPEREGIETIMEIRALAPATRILAVSGGGRVNPLEFLKLATGLGADAGLAKPFRREAFLDAVRAVAALSKPPS